MKSYRSTIMRSSVPGRRFYDGGWIFLLLIMFCCLNVWAQPEAKSEKVKNVIVLIGDGCGFNHLQSTACYRGESSGLKVFKGKFKQFAVSTYSNEGSYDPVATWKDFQFSKTGATDSAAAATALATGVKTKNGMIGVDPGEKPLENVVERAEKAKKSTGVITTVPFSHATPAGFSAHKSSRAAYDSIAQEMLQESGLEVIMGAGHPWYDADGRKVADVDSQPADKVKKSYQYVGGSDLWKQLVAGNVANDCDGDGKPDAWKMIQSRSEFQALAKGDTPKRIVGVAQTESTLQQKRTSVVNDPAKDIPGQTPLVATSPTLAEMTSAALNVLDNNPNGLFLMVEGGAIDWASHGNQLGRMIEEGEDFIGAIEAVCAWVEANSNWKETLVVVTADHETGYLNGTGSDPAWRPIKNNGKGKVPGAMWYSKGHTNNLVPLYIRGAGLDRFKKALTHADSKRGKYLDNTDIGKIVGVLLSE